MEELNRHFIELSLVERPIGWTFKFWTQEMLIFQLIDHCSPAGQKVKVRNCNCGQRAHLSKVNRKTWINDSESWKNSPQLAKHVFHYSRHTVELIFLQGRAIERTCLLVRQPLVDAIAAEGVFAFRRINRIFWKVKIINEFGSDSHGNRTSERNRNSENGKIIFGILSPNRN